MAKGEAWGEGRTAETGFLPLWHPKPAPIRSNKIAEQECLIFICIYNLPPVKVFREDTKSYYRYFGWSTLKQLCPSYLRNGQIGQGTRFLGTRRDMFWIFFGPRV